MTDELREKIDELIKAQGTTYGDVIRVPKFSSLKTEATSESTKLDLIIAHWEEYLRENKTRLNFAGLSIIEATLEELKILRNISLSPEEIKRLQECRIRLLEYMVDLQTMSPEALASVQRGLEDAKAGRVSKVDLS